MLSTYRFYAGRHRQKGNRLHSNETIHLCVYVLDEISFEYEWNPKSASSGLAVSELAGSASFSRLDFVAHRPFRSITDKTEEASVRSDRSGLGAERSIRVSFASRHPRFHRYTDERKVNNVNF